MESRPSLRSFLQITLLKLTGVRFRDGSCSKVRSFTYPTWRPIPNALSEREKLLAFAPFLAFPFCEKVHQLALSLWDATQCGHSPTVRLSCCKPSPIKPSIAIENVRLFEAEQKRTEELSECAGAADRHRRRAQGHQPLDF